MNLKMPELLPDNDKPESVRNWRIRQALISCSSLALLTFFVLPALIGVPYALPRLGQVAWASEANSLKSELSDIKVHILTQSILAAQKERCSSNSGQHSLYWTEQLNNLKREYWQLTGQNFELPPAC